ncbi:hypothetical protein INR79_09110 [Vibrio sp. SCSIO 43132]|uniref:hypothetical protein n=1 Tax=Vibrio sp. SCSIO 43132 TaxID=2779363 RepID=UPI001CA8985C|nr:hypothetical protein [Vibrio sp. SCSIO 43132]UAB68711.1 hypothetical protein INR79_09110 [Vibrio sp. SCSIO 43132]
MKKLLFTLLSITSSLTTFAAEVIHKDWVINTDGDDYYYAATINSSDHIFGKYCYFKDQQCLFLIGVDIVCTTGNQYPVLINAESGSLNLNLVCGDRVGDQNVLVFDNFDKIEKTAKESKQLGIAIPMESGHFKVSRFSLSGSTYSLDTMTEEAEKRVSLSNVDSELL